MMYFLFREHHITPGRYNSLPDGEKVILRAFFEMEMEARNNWLSSR